jgi:hypothetical protein
MKWLILAILAEVSVLLCLIFAFDGALHSMASARLTWDHAAVSVLYAAARMHFSWRRATGVQERLNRRTRAILES